MAKQKLACLSRTFLYRFCSEVEDLMCCGSEHLPPVFTRCAKDYIEKMPDEPVPCPPYPYQGSFHVFELTIFRFVQIQYALSVYDDDAMKVFFDSKCHSVCFLCSDPSNLTARKPHIKILPGSLGDR